MSAATKTRDESMRRKATMSPAWFMVPSMVVVGCAMIATAAPIRASIIAVFLFAGPHNWMEARYFLARMPARWGGLAPYFSVGLAGSLVLSGLFAGLPSMAGSDADASLLLIAIWNSLLTVWIVVLAVLRRRQNPRRDWPYLIPFGFLLIALNWIAPLAWSLALVYLHPVLAMVFLDRELQQKSLAWRKAFLASLMLIPVSLIAMIAKCADSPDVSGSDPLTWQITYHAGAGILPHVSPRLLVTAHVFLELLHYVVWILVIPFTTQRISWRRILDVPLARRSPEWRLLVTAILAMGAMIMVILWASFLTDYVLTRHIYFTVAILHVLMEIPFLLRSL